MEPVIYFMLISLNYILVLALPEWIVPIKDEIEVKEVKDAYIVAGQWTLLIRLDEPAMPPEFLRFVTKFKANVANENTMVNWQRQGKQCLDVLYQRCQRPSRWWQTAETWTFEYYWQGIKFSIRHRY